MTRGTYQDEGAIYSQRKFLRTAAGALSRRAASISRASCLWDDYPADLGKCAHANCNTCHSLDYIPMNSVFLDRKGWEGEVNIMIKVTDAPIKQEGVPQIVDYLAAQYGK